MLSKLSLFGFMKILLIWGMFFFSYAVFAQDTSDEEKDVQEVNAERNHKLFAGIGQMPIKISGYRNAVFNDYHNYPEQAGATHIEFEKGNVDEMVSGFLIGYQYRLDQNQAVVVDWIFLNSGDIGGNVLSVGYAYEVELMENLGIAIIPKYGFGSVTANMGEVESNGTMPIEINDETYDTGDEIVASASGSVINLSLEVNYGLSEISPGFGVFFQYGMQKSNFEKPKTKIANDVIEDGKAFDDGSVENGSLQYDPDSNIDPFSKAEVSMDGSSLAIGISYLF